MKHLPILVTLLFASSALAEPEVLQPFTATTSGVDGENLNATPVTDAIDMQSGSNCNQLAVTLAITPGSTTSVTLYCSEGESSTVTAHAKINRCPSGACTPDVRTYTLSNYDTVNGVKYITARFPVAKRYASCTASGSGTGTVVVTGTRSRQ